uniref:BT4734/BF3469 family protein n=1 Tax=Flavobacterium sp. TaxID=239 RepID=UPI00404B0E14
MKIIKISFIESIDSSKMRPAEIRQVLECIKKGSWKKKIDPIRKAFDNNDLELANSLKMALPAFTPSGTFNERRKKENIDSYSGLLHLDYDKVEDVESLKEIIVKIPFTYSAFISPSGKGLKVIVNTDAKLESHTDAFNTLRAYYDGIVGFESDKSVKDVTRLCFVSYDPNLYLKESSEIFRYLKRSYNVSEIWDFTAKIMDFKIGNRNNFVHQFACNANRHGIDIIETIRFASNYTDYTFTLDEIENTIKNIYKKNVFEAGKYKHKPLEMKSKQEPNIVNSDSILTYKKANEWIEAAKLRPNPKKLFGTFWFENEVCILFADTNVGKSILAMQISHSISKGEKVEGFDLESESQKVLYFDFELSDKQFQIRYTNEENQAFKFDENLIRIEINSDSLFEEDIPFEEILINSLVSLIEKTNAKVLIIDNLTYLSAENEKAKDALPLMKKLKKIKNKYGLSLLILAHTPKRDASKGITKNDLSGSKMLINFCDSAFAIGESFQKNGLRYLKQIKVRNAIFEYDLNNIVLCQIKKSDSFLLFEYIGLDSEQKHLRIVSKEEKNDMIVSAIELN